MTIMNKQMEGTRARTVSTPTITLSICHPDSMRPSQAERDSTPKPTWTTPSTILRSSLKGTITWCLRAILCQHSQAKLRSPHLALSMCQVSKWTLTMECQDTIAYSPQNSWASSPSQTRSASSQRAHSATTKTQGASPCAVRKATSLQTPASFQLSQSVVGTSSLKTWQEELRSVSHRQSHRPTFLRQRIWTKHQSVCRLVWHKATSPWWTVVTQTTRTWQARGTQRQMSQHRVRTFRVSESSRKRQCLKADMYRSHLRMGPKAAPKTLKNSSRTRPSRMKWLRKLPRTKTCLLWTWLLQTAYFRMDGCPRHPTVTKYSHSRATKGPILLW